MRCSANCGRLGGCLEEDVRRYKRNRDNLQSAEYLSARSTQNEEGEKMGMDCQRRTAKDYYLLHTYQSLKEHAIRIGIGP
jgi:hypothetical protein